MLSSRNVLIQSGSGSGRRFPDQSAAGVGLDDGGSPRTYTDMLTLHIVLISCQLHDLLHVCHCCQSWHNCDLVVSLHFNFFSFQYKQYRYPFPIMYHLPFILKYHVPHFCLFL